MPRHAYENAEGHLRRLEDELYRARHDIVHLMAPDIAQLLTSYYSCHSRRDYWQWKRETIEKIIELAKPDPEASYFQERGYCPLCKGGSLGPYDRGFTIPEGLRRHLEGFGNTNICPVTNAAFSMATDSLREEFEAADKTEEERTEQRRKTERVFLTELDTPPKFLEEGLWHGKPRSAEEFAAVEQRLQALGFETAANANVVSYQFKFDSYLVMADPRAVGRIDFRIYNQEKTKKRLRNQSRSFHLLDSWKNDIADKFRNRLMDAVQALSDAS